MDNNQLLLMWAVIVGATLIVDAGTYLFLRAEWKKSGVLLTDKFWSLLRDRLVQFVKTALKTLRPVRPQLASVPAPASAPVVDEIPVEIIPVSVQMVGGEMRRVEFVVDMAMNTTVNVRVGATREAGVKVEKREL